MSIPSLDRISGLTRALDYHDHVSQDKLRTISSIDSTIQKTDLKITTIEARIEILNQLLQLNPEERAPDLAKRMLAERLAEKRIPILENYNSLLLQRDAIIESGQQILLTPARKDDLRFQFCRKVDTYFQRSVEDFQLEAACNNSRLEEMHTELVRKDGEKRRKYADLLEHKEAETFEWIYSRENHQALQAQRAAAIEGTAHTPWEAAENGDVHFLSTFLREQRNFNINQQNEEGHTCLTLAVAHQQEQIVHLLLERNADPNIADKNGYLPIHWAARIGNIQIAQSLFRKFILPHQRTSYINSRAEFGRTPLNMAVFGGHLPMVKLCLQLQANINAKTDREGGGLTPLHLAIQRGHFPIALFLMTRRNLQVCVEDSAGKTPLHYAVIAQSAPIASLIIAHPTFCKILQTPRHPYHPSSIIPEDLAQEDPIFKACRETFG